VKKNNDGSTNCLFIIPNLKPQSTPRYFSIDTSMSHTTCANIFNCAGRSCAQFKYICTSRASRQNASHIYGKNVVLSMVCALDTTKKILVEQ